MIKKGERGFTLIELLIVIVLIGILSGFLLSVLRPGDLRARANQSVMDENLNKLVMAVQACINSRSNPTACAAASAANGATFPNTLAVTNPAGKPTSGTVYRIYNSGSTIVVDAALGGTYANTGTPTLCQIRNVIDTGSGAVTRTVGTQCLID